MVPMWKKPVLLVSVREGVILRFVQGVQEGRFGGQLEGVGFVGGQNERRLERMRDWWWRAPRVSGKGERREMPWG